MPVVAGLSLVLSLTACGNGAPAPATFDSTRLLTIQASPSARPTPSMEPAFSAAEDGPWGPLAVVRGFSGGDFARMEGTLAISEQCVFIDRSNGQSWLLIWGSEHTRWDEVRGAIVFESPIPRRGVVRIHDGQYVELGGSGQFFSEQAPAAEAVGWNEWLARYDWVAEPDRSCNPSGYWSVGAIAPLDR